ncbi:MAG: hypothetical protein D6814_14240 [Calditrichaeota bacterium]|nr:MAG: hypothetical protein D6814_14240 [Calditrichota bacterium]
MRSTTSKLAIAAAAALAGILFEKQSFAAVAGLAGFCSLCAAAINYFGIRPAMGETREKQSMEGK